MGKLIEYNESGRIAEFRVSPQQMQEMFNLQNLTEPQFLTFCAFCKQHSLDPFLKQIYAWEHRGMMVLHVGLAGWLAVANRHPAFDGMEHGFVYFGDKFQLLPRGNYSHEPGNHYGDVAKIKQAYCLVYRKDRSIPTRQVVRQEPYMKADHFAWKQFKEEMLEKVVIGRAIREAFAFVDFDPARDVVINEQGQEVDQSFEAETVETNPNFDPQLPVHHIGRIRRVLKDLPTKDEIVKLHDMVMAECQADGRTWDEFDKKYPGTIDLMIDKFYKDINMEAENDNNG